MTGLIKQYLWIANIVVILFCSYFAAKIVNVYIGKAIEVRRAIGVMKKPSKASPLRPSRLRADYDIITKRNIFDSTEQIGPEPQGPIPSRIPKPKPGQEAVKTALPIKLYAVLVVGDGKDERSSATVEYQKKVDVYTVGGDDTFAGVSLVQIKPLRIEFINKGILEYAELEEEGAASIFGPPGDIKTASKGKTVKKSDESTVATEEGKFVVDQREIDNAMNNLDRMLTEIRAVPNFQDGRVSGLKVLSVKPGSLFSKLGIKRGDILSRINGIELDVRKGFDMFNQLKDQKNFTLDLVRGGMSQTFDYEIR